MRKFNTSGPNIPAQHYTLPRTYLIGKGQNLVYEDRYFTIWAPRQTGKSTYFRLLADALAKEGYLTAHINFENYRKETIASFLTRLSGEMGEFWNMDFSGLSLGEVFYKIEKIQGKKLVLIVDEVEGINAEYLGDFLHAIRNAYHARNKHSLKSVILVGVSNILGIIQDNASPFNIADNLNIPYFTNEETAELLGQHEAETGQLFAPEVKAKISEITANQPGLVNGFAKKLVEDHPDKPEITYEDYLKVEDWYLTEAIDKNFSNILNKVQPYREFLEKLLFKELHIPFDIDREAIKALHTLGLIRKDEDGNVVFWVPFYKKRLYKALYPYTNGEGQEIRKNILLEEFSDAQGTISFEKIIEHYREWVKRRGFAAFREKDEAGNYKSIKEAALVYSFETYIQAFLSVAQGKSYREAHTGLGRSDLIVNLKNQEYLIELKVYSDQYQFKKGKGQLAYYCRSLGLEEGVYLVFIPNHIKFAQMAQDEDETIHELRLKTRIVLYDEEKDFG
ncbi:MAG: hypothetical protein HC880_17575 [Bacteroidia bacterium]|nr:hypothetical protein [Bacteroidia bacterium]